jgi:EamA domain-containing membrane protein RarD
MKSLLKTQVSIPELGLIAGTRAMLGAGIALLLANRLSQPQRKAVGWTLVAVGAVTTIPLVMQVVGGRRAVKTAEEPEHTTH